MLFFCNSAQVVRAGNSVVQTASRKAAMLLKPAFSSAVKAHFTRVAISASGVNTCFFLNSSVRLNTGTPLAGEENGARDSRIDGKLEPAITAGKLSSSSTLSSTALSSPVSPKPPEGSASGRELSVSSLSSTTAWGRSIRGRVKRTLEAEMCEVALLGATIGDGVVGAVVPWGLYSIGSNILPSTCLRCPPWVLPLGKLW